MPGPVMSWCWCSGRRVDSVSSWWCWTVWCSVPVPAGTGRGRWATPSLQQIASWISFDSPLSGWSDTMVGLPPPLNLFTIAHSPVKFQVSSFQFQVREARVDLAFRPASKLLLSLLTTNNWPLTTVVCHPVYNDVGVVKRHGSL